MFTTASQIYCDIAIISTNTYMMFLLLAVLCISAGYVSAQAPTFCRNAECPIFKVLNTTQGYEIRQYGSIKLAATSYTGPWHSNVLGVLFGRIYNYIQGANRQGNVIDMTVPIITRIESAGREGTRYTMHLVMPEINLKNTPIPIDASISIITQPKTKYFVRSFSGFANGQVYVAELQRLVTDINNPKLYNNNVFYTATYDSPSIKTNRHNEIWLEKL